MTLYHCSPSKNLLNEIHNNGLFGEFLFFSSKPSHYGDHVYSIDINTDNDVIAASSLFYHDNWKILEEIVEETAELLNCDKDKARDYLDESRSVEVSMDGGELAFELQLLTARCAKKLGYIGVQVTDEHGGSWMIDVTHPNIKLMAAA